jgi:hypothetical protein
MMIARESGKEKAAAGSISFIGPAYAEQNTAIFNDARRRDKTREFCSEIATA